MMKAKVLVGMLCIGLLGFTACDKDEDNTPSPGTAGVSSSNDDNTIGDPQPGDDVSLEDGSGMLDNGRAGNERVDVTGKYFISYFENGTPTGGVDVTSQYEGYIFTIDERRLIISGNGVNLEGSFRIDEDRRVVEMHLPPNDKLTDLDQYWSLNELTPGIIGMASAGMDAPRDGMILTRLPELRVAPRSK